jgi:hypothetical protein
LRLTVADTLRKMPTMLFVIVVSGFLQVLGLVLFVVPGVIIGARLMLVLPIVVCEDIGPRPALRRSWKMSSMETGALIEAYLIAVLTATAWLAATWYLLPESSASLRAVIAGACWILLLPAWLGLVVTVYEKVGRTEL